MSSSYKFLHERIQKRTHKLLPQFSKCDATKTTEAWSQGLRAADWKAITAGDVVPASVLKKVVSWIKAEIDNLTTEGAPLLEHMDEDTCYRVSRIKAKEKPHTIQNPKKYVSIPIGVNAQGRIVYEGVHRLVCWLDNAWGPSYNVAMHVGRPNRACVHEWCINHHHLEWGDHQQNAEDYQTRRRRGGG
jgi:hypothetical protein